MEGLLLQLGLVALLASWNTAFAGAKLALVSLREGQLQRVQVTAVNRLAMSEVRICPASSEAR